MAIKLTKKLKEEKIKCDSCGIFSGPLYETKDLKPLKNASVFLCPQCYGALKAEGFLYLEDTTKRHIIMLPNGEKKKITNNQLEKLRQKLSKPYLSWRP
jgi:hypothetical protein